MEKTAGDDFSNILKNFGPDIPTLGIKIPWLYHLMIPISSGTSAITCSWTLLRRRDSLGLTGASLGPHRAISKWWIPQDGYLK
jgi:hypothetical protein